jgi:NAD(P)-dependent dehydrogenase (short-subunit alcohol dehydrogenase family)
MGLDGKVALVTGGTRGIGRGIAEAFAAAGATVVVNARKPDEIDETVKALSAIPGVGGVSSVQGSAADPDVVHQMMEHCVREHGRLDVLVNNAATNPQFGPLIEADMNTVAKVWEVNLAGPLRCMQEAWRAWMKDNGGVVLNVVSVGGLRPGPGIGAYNVGKAALTHLTKQLAMELAPGVRVNAIAPGLVKTKFAQALWEPNEAAANRMQALGRIGVPDDIAPMALFLCSDAASWMTGEVVVVDGGAGVSMRG